MNRGDTIGGRFRLIRELGRGGMGVVWEAENMRSKTNPEEDAKVAIKVMDPKLARDKSHRDQFLNEARNAARVEHPNVVRMLGWGWDDPTKSLYIAMELLEGETLDAFVKRHPSIDMVAVDKLIDQFAAATKAIHDHGIVHRDLKPTNIMICASKETDDFVLKVIDFGIALAIDDDFTHVVASRAGSMRWRAPEQHPGQQSMPGQMRRQTDVWAIGLVVFWILTKGTLYWKNEDPEEPLKGVTDPPSIRIYMLGKSCSLPAGFDAWFEKCLALKPHDRQADARMAFDELFAILRSNEPKESLVCPVLLLLVILVILAVVAVVIYLILLQLSPRPPL